MQDQTTNTQNAIADLLSRVEHKNLRIEGNPQNRWFLIRHAKLGSVFNRPVAHVMVKFLGDSGDPVIFVPEKIQINNGAQVCPNFLAATPCLKAWKTLCPHMFQDVGDDLLQFIACLCGFLANPDLCGCMGCPGKDNGTEHT